MMMVGLTVTPFSNLIPSSLSIPPHPPHFSASPTFKCQPFITTRKPHHSLPLLVFAANNNEKQMKEQQGKPPSSSSGSNSNGQEEGVNNNNNNFTKQRRPFFGFNWNTLLDPDPDNVLALGLTGLLTWASVQVLWQLLFISLAILVAALKYSFIAALLIFILIALL